MKNYFFNQQTITFLISLLIAFGLWLLIKLSGDFQTDNNVYLRYQNFPFDKVLINNPDSVLTIRTNNNGFDVITQFIFGHKKTLNIDFADAKYLNNTNGVRKYYILCSSLQNEIEDEFRTVDHILNIRPDSIIFAFEKLDSKKLAIIPQLDLSYNHRYKQYNKMKITPDSIVFFGPSTLLKSLISINTKKFKMQDISSNIDTTIYLDLPNDKLKGQQEKIKLYIDVEEYTEGKIRLPIKLKSDTKFHYKIFPSEAQITYQVALKDYAKINAASFEIRAIPDSLEPGKLYLHLNNHPDNVIVSNIQPSSAEYIILK